MKMTCKFEITNCNSTEETIKFDSETHAEQSREIISIFNADLDNWVVARIAVYCPLNRKIARLLSISHIGCFNHRQIMQAENFVQENINYSE